MTFINWSPARRSILLACHALLAISPAMARASTIVVDPSGGGDFADIPAALQAAQPGDVVEVRPGTYDLSAGPLDFGGKAITLTSSEGASATILDAAGQPTCITMTQGEGADTVVSGFTLTGATSSAVAIQGASPTLRDLAFQDNVSLGTETGGAGLSVSEGSATLEGCTFLHNESLSGGGAVSVVLGTLTLHDVRFYDNTTEGRGGALYLETLTEPVALSRVAFLENAAQTGGAVYTEGEVNGTNLLFAANSAEYGGALACSTGTLALTNITVAGNFATGAGAAIAGDGCSGTLTNALFAYNKAATGGVVAHLGDPASDSYAFFYADFYRNGPDPFSNAAPPDGDDILEVDPGFQYYIDDLSSSEDDFHLFPGSRLIDAGHPNEAFNDVDGSRSDIGAYGGPFAETGYAADDDGDGMPDTWETAHGLDPASNDAVYDLDADGVINLHEYQYGLLPDRPDTDGDMLADQEELDAGTDPRDTFDPYETLTVPNAIHATIQSALNAAHDGVTIDVLPGTYPESLDFLGKSVHLRSTGGADVTTITGEDSYPVATLRFGEDETTVIEGFTLSDGMSWDDGGGMAVLHGSPTLLSLNFTGNWAAGDGGALWVRDGHVTGSQLLFDANGSSGTGGAVAVLDATVAFTGVTFSANYGFYGGGALDATSSEVALASGTFSSNSSAGDGGAISSTSSLVRLEDLAFTANETTGDGGAIAADGGELELTRIGIESGQCSDAGGGIYATGGAVVQAGNLLVNAVQAYRGGAIAVESAAVVHLDHATIVGCYASSEGGAIHVSGSEVSLSHSVVAYNLSPAGGGVFAESVFEQGEEEGSEVEIPAVVAGSYTDIHGNRSADYAGMDPFDGSGSQDVDPDFVHYTDDGKAEGDDLHLRPDSPLVDAGDPNGPRDPDGSVADLGAFGGPNADFSYYDDADNDGMADGFESAMGLDPQSDDAAGDPDGDGLSNLEEAQAASDPFEPDTDGDGLSDQEEIDSGGDPTDAFSPRGWAAVPETFATIQEAIDAAKGNVEIRVNPGTYQENLDLLGKPITLVGTEGPDVTVIDGRSLETVITMHLGESSATRVADLTIANGSATIGGGIYLDGASPVLENLVLHDNDATVDGGGLASQGGSPTLVDIRAYGNTTGEWGQGGGLYLEGGEPEVVRGTFTDNTASSGAGIYLYDTSATLRNTLVAGNEAGYGGGISIRFATTPTLINVTSHSNTAAGGAGIFVETSSVLAVNTVLTGNRAPVGAGILVRDESSSVLLVYCNVWGNYGEDYGGDVLYDQTGENGNLSVDPRYQAFSLDGDWTNDDLHLRPDSPLRNGGDPSLQNPDGTVSDQGNYGGPDADRSYYEDSDSDGMYDGWEVLSGLDPAANDASLDADDDGLPNNQEFNYGTDPQSSDSDGDDIPDADELADGSDPTDFFSPNDTIVVTDYFDSIQDALDAARDGVTLLLEEGVYHGQIEFGGKDVVLRGLGDPEKTILDGDGTGPVVAFRYGESRAARLERLTIRNGVAPDGGGIRIVESHPSFDRIIVRDNGALHSGGGLSIINAWPTLTNCLITGNDAEEGGGIGARESLPTLIGVTIAGNQVSGSGGGFSCIDLCSPTILNSVIAFNDAERGGGVNIVAPQLVTFENNNVYGNSLDNYSGSYPDQTDRKGNISEDPSFTSWNSDGEDPDFHPQPDSPLVDAGKDVSKSGITWDLDGIPRPADGDGDGERQFDMGAYELELDVDFDGFLPSEGDCGEGDPSIYPGATEVCDDDIDQDCDGEDVSCSTIDGDGDGFSQDEGDCDDENPNVYPDATEEDNNVDDDCDGEVDEGLDTATPPVPDDAGGCSCDTSTAVAGASPARSPISVPFLGAFLLLAMCARTLLQVLDRGVTARTPARYRCHRDRRPGRVARKPSESTPHR